MTATTLRPAHTLRGEQSPSVGATTRERALAIGLWAVVVGALGFGIVATLVKAGGLFVA